jgi:hypothetical protein
VLVVVVVLLLLLLLRRPAAAAAAAAAASACCCVTRHHDVLQGIRGCGICLDSQWDARGLGCQVYIQPLCRTSGVAVHDDGTASYIRHYMI